MVRIRCTMEAVGMMRNKCKKTVFCVQFLVYFFLGTICGIFLFRCLLLSDPMWIYAYSNRAGSLGSGQLLCRLIYFFLPLILAWVLSLSPFGYRVLPLLIMLRGCLTAYLFSFQLYGDGSMTGSILRSVLILPLFYYICQKAYCSHIGGIH